MGTFAHLGVLPPANRGLLSALNNTSRQLGLGSRPWERCSRLGSRGWPEHAESFTGALADLFLVAVVVNLVAAAAAALLVRQDDLWVQPAAGAGCGLMR